MACDCYAPIYSMMRPLVYTQSSRVTVLAFNLKPVFTFYYSALFVGLMHMSNPSAQYLFLQAMVAWSGAIFEISHNIEITAIKKSVEDLNEMISHCIYTWHDQTSRWYGNDVKGCSFVALAVLIHQLLSLSFSHLCFSLSMCVFSLHLVCLLSSYSPPTV